MLLTNSLHRYRIRGVWFLLRGSQRILKALNRAATLRIAIKLMLTTKALKTTVIDLVRNENSYSRT